MVTMKSIFCEVQNGIQTLKDNLIGAHQGFMELQA